MLVSLGQAKIYLGIDASDTTYDTFLTQQITLISDTVEQYCRRKFKKATYIQTFYKEEIPQASWNKRIQLNQFPAASVTSILRKDKVADTGVAFTEYRLNKPTSTIVAEDCNTIFDCYKLIQVTYTAGYDSSKIPSPILDVVYSLVGERYNKKKNGIDLNFGSDVQRVSIPGTISVDYDFSLDSNSRQATFGAIIGSYANVLDMYRSENAVIGTEELVYVE